MRQSAKRFPRALLVLVVLTVMALLLTSCAYDAGYRIGEIAEKARVKAMEILEKLFEGFKEGSGWWGRGIEQFFPSDATGDRP